MVTTQGTISNRQTARVGAKTSVIVNNKQFEPILHFWNIGERPGVSLSRQEVIQKVTLNKVVVDMFSFCPGSLITRAQQ